MESLTESVSKTDISVNHTLIIRSVDTDVVESILFGPVRNEKCLFARFTTSTTRPETSFARRITKIEHILPGEIPADTGVFELTLESMNDETIKKVIIEISSNPYDEFLNYIEKQAAEGLVNLKRIALGRGIRGL